MNEEQASIAYWKAVDLLKEVIESGHREGIEEVLEELREDIE